MEGQVHDSFRLFFMVNGVNTRCTFSKVLVGQEIAFVLNCNVGGQRQQYELRFVPGTDSRWQFTNPDTPDDLKAQADIISDIIFEYDH